MDLPRKNLDDSSDLRQEFDIDLKRSSKSRFGFSISGGYEDSPDIRLSYIEEDGVADCDGRLKLHDVILQLNKISFKGISHKKAVRKFRSAGKHIRMRIQRFMARTTDDMPTYVQKDSSRLSIAGTMCSDSNEQIQPISQNIPCTDQNSKERRRNSENQSYPIHRSVKEYEVGIYHGLKRRLLRRIDLKLHQLLQPDIASTIIPEYKESDAICIALDTSRFDSPPSMSQDQINSLLHENSSKKILVHAIVCNTKPRTIPSPVLLEAIQLHCQKFPLIYSKAMLVTIRQDFATLHCDVKELVFQIPLIYPHFLSTVLDIMKYGNRVKDIPVKVRRFLEETETSELSSWENGNHSGKYLAHQDTNTLTDRPRLLIVHIRFNDTETRKEESYEYIKTITTYINNVAVSYQ